MRKLRTTLTILCALGALYGAAMPSPASAAGVSPVITDCSLHGTLTKHYPVAELRYAQSHMPVDDAEYTNCPDVIRRALLADIGPINGGSGSGGGSFLPVWVIVVLALLVVAGAASGVVALRNRGKP